MEAMLSSPSAPIDRLRIGLVGAGRWGMTHLRTLIGVCPDLVAVVFDPSDEARATAATLAPAARLLPAFDVKNAGLLHGVIVATPTKTHAEIAADALGAGIHVLLEKPMARCFEDAMQIRQAASASSATCLVGHQMLHHPAVECLMRSIAAGVIGRPRALVSIRTSKERAGDDPLWALGPHDLALALLIAGRPPVRVDARRSASRAEVTLDFGHDFRALLTFQRTPSEFGPGPRTTQVVGEHAALMLDEGLGELSLESRGTVRTLFAAHGADPLHRQLVHFLDCIEGRALPRSTASAAALAVSILERAAQAIEASVASSSGSSHATPPTP